VNVNQVAQTDLTPPPAGALAVEVHHHVLGTADVEVVVDAAAEPHPAVHGGSHHYYLTWPTGGVEHFVQTVVTRSCISKSRQPVESAYIV